MPSATNLTPDRRFKALFVGPGKCGKTSAACSFMTKGSDKRVKVLDCDGRINGLLGSPWVDRSRIDYDYFPPRIADNPSPYFMRVNESLDSMLVDFKNNKNMYETYVGDSLTAHCQNLVFDCIPMTHAGGKGNKIGAMNVTGVEEFKFESNGAASYLAFLRSIPINVIVTAHIVPKWGKPPGGNPYSDNIIIGEELSIRPKISAASSIYFDHIFRFDRKIINDEQRFFVEFISDIACTSFPNLKPGKYDITGFSFYDELMKLINGLESKIKKVP